MSGELLSKDVIGGVQPGAGSDKPLAAARPSAEPIPKFSRVVDHSLLERIRNLPACEWCRKKPKKGERLDPHHIKTRGSGGGDTADNVIGLCRWCHRLAQDNKISKAKLRERVAMREDEANEQYATAVLALENTPGYGVRNREASTVQETCAKCGHSWLRCRDN